MDTKYNHQKSMEMTEQKLKDLGITRSFEQLYDEIYCGPESKKRTKDFKILSDYYKSVGLEIQSLNANPYHIYNHYYYYDGINEEGKIM